jgi:S-DNA-T family DNA segregation ATPase FtsK/SpoIIIE
VISFDEALAAEPARAVSADVLVGPDSGRSILLLPGAHRIGRGSDADVVLDDPSVSRHHADLLVADDWSLTIVPVVGVANGVAVNDAFVHEATTVASDDVVALGGTRLAFREVERNPHTAIDRLGQIDFCRTPYRRPVVGRRGDVTIGPIPDRPDPRRLQLLGTVAPLVAGLAMYAFTHQIQFLALTAISPMVVIGNAWHDRRSGRVTFGEQVAAFRAVLVEQRRRLEAMRADERVERLRAAPDLADLSRRAQLRTVDLWARGRRSPDFLQLRFGHGADHVGYTIELAGGGATELRDEAWAAVAGLDELDAVPVVVDLTTDAVIGIHGEPHLVGGVAASLVTQGATLHSPEDLTIVAAVAEDRGFDWLRCLPHVRSVASPVPGEHVVATAAGADELVAGLLEVIAFRGGEASDLETPHSWPRVLVLLDADLCQRVAEVSRLLDRGPAAGISVVWMAGSLAAVPRQATRVLAVRRGEGAAMLGRLWSTDPEVPEHELEVEHLRRTGAERVARALAPVRDASTASRTTSIPRVVSLLEVLGTRASASEWVTGQWSAPPGNELRFPIGIGAAGPVCVDLVEHGPHTLLGGTSGAGKSELLQSMVAALAVRYPPTRLNFLFVDYKGGAASKVFETLPHTVGYVTNLSDGLAMRALISLRAELDRRMRVLDGRAKDLAELRLSAPDDVPPSLVILVDEFATLVREIPEFVAGIVDIAQRGRSLGIHLVLATQRPSGAVDDNILANTNLRISLRMLDRSDSMSVIDSPDAAAIPVPLKGRAFARLGPRQLVEFQSAFASAPVDGVGGGEASATSIAPVTQLSLVIDAIVDAAASCALPAPRRPWCEPLPDLVNLGSLADHVRSGAHATDPGRYVTVGLLDVPEQQQQRPAVIDLEDGGGCLVFGSGGSGKTTLLRTIAASLSAIGSHPDSECDRDSEHDCEGDSGGDVAIVGFDFGSRGLAGIRPLPSVVDVATGDDLEAVTRHLTLLDRELTRRRRLLADAGAENLTAYNRSCPPLPRVVVLVDGFGAMMAAFAGSITTLGGTSPELWAEMIQRMVVDGRQVGMHVVLAADRVGAVPARIQSAVGCRIILRHVDRAAYVEHGVPFERAGALELGVGRGLMNGSTLVQIASVSRDPSARAQCDEIAALAATSGRRRTTLLASTRLPASVTLDRLGTACERRLQPCIGLHDITGAPAVVDLEWSHMAVCGPPRSGRSTALATIVEALGSEHEVFVVAPGSSPLAGAELPRSTIAARRECVAELLDRLANLVDMGVGRRPRVLVVDDLDRLDDVALAPAWDRLANADGVRVVAAVETRSMTGYTQNPILGMLRRTNRVLVLRPDDAGEFLAMTGVRLPIRPGVELPPGRGVLLADRVASVLQVALPGADDGGRQWRAHQAGGLGGEREVGVAVVG